MTSKENARQIYRGAWTEYILATDPDRKLELERIMDSVQDSCVTPNERPYVPCGEHNPAMEEWKTFAATLPGYVAFWDMADEEFDAMREQLDGLVFNLKD